jgi:hypothetical protein
MLMYNKNVFLLTFITCNIFVFSEILHVLLFRLYFYFYCLVYCLVFCTLRLVSYPSVVWQVFLFMKRICIYVCIGLHVKYPIFLSDFNVIWILSINLRKCSYQISWKSVQWEPSCSTQTDGQTEMIRQTVAFHSVCIYQVLCAML